MTPPPSSLYRLLLIAGVLLLLSGLSGLAAPEAAAVPGDRPVKIVISEITPKVAGPGTVIEVRGVLVNSADVSITDLTVRLQRGPVLDSRSDLADYDSDPVEVNDASTDFVNLARPLAASGVLPFTYATTPEDLRLSASGSYPLLVNLNGRPEGEPASRIGEEVILLPYLAEAPTAVTELSWLWPLVAEPERNSLGVFTGTSLATSVGRGGRLDVALSAVESSPGQDGAAPGVPPTPHQVTLAVDPELLEAVQVLANGDYQLLVGGQQQTSTIGSLEAAAWLTRLRALALTHPVVSFPYADPDIATLTARGQGQAVERMLPDGNAGELVSEILGVAPVTSIAWPPDGAASSTAVLEMLAEHGVTQVVTDDLLTFEPADQASVLEPVSTLETPAGPLTALTADHVLSEMLGRDTSAAGAQALTEERFLAELVAATLVEPGRGRHLLIAPARDFDPVTAAALISAAAGNPWLGTELATGLATGVSERSPRTVLSIEPPSAIPNAQLTQLLSALRDRDDFASTLQDPDTALLPLDRALARAATVNRPSDSDVQNAVVLDAVAAVTALRATVGLVPPANGTYSLASEDAPLVLTVFNDNPFPVEVIIALSPRGASGVRPTSVTEELPAQSRTPVAVPADVQQSGSFTVIARVTTPAGDILGTPVQLRVQSTVYGPVALAITFGAAALLALLFARRSVKYWKRRGAAKLGSPDVPQPSASDEPHEPEPELIDAPRRSPV